MTRAHCQRCEELEEQVRQLRAELRGLDRWQAPPEFGLTAMEAAILEALYARNRFLTHNTLWEATRGVTRYKRDSHYPNTIQVQISNIRRKIERLGMTIENQPGAGYRLPPDTRRRLANWDRERAAA